MKFRYKITVFTPTYNRAYILEKLYYSLKRQTFKNFEWLIVDDGSTDNTEQEVKNWMNDNNVFSIRYYKQKNGGKCRAINTGLDLADGKIFFTVDSDDYLLDDALEKIIFWESQLPLNEKYCGVAGNLGTEAEQTKNTRFKGEFFDGNLLDRYRNVDGERAIAIYTDIHRKYKYPEFKGEKFMTEAIVYNRLAHDGYKMRFYNDIIWIYEYREDGLTKAGTKLFVDNPYGYGLWLKEKSEYMHENLEKKFGLYYAFTCELMEKYSDEVIAECIGVHVSVIKMCKIVRKLKKNIWRNRK